MSAENLSQMGAAKVQRLVDQYGQQVIDKCPVSPVEYAFYEHAAEELNSRGIKTPTLLSADPHPRRLRLEYIPGKVSQDEVSGDDILKCLSHLHCTPPDPTWVYHPHSWPEKALEKSLALLRLPDRAAHQMRCFQQAGSVLFRQKCLLSGDTNAGNWGRRENGEWVLFDWERFGTGSPAIDLAPLVKGMGSRQSILQLAERYSVHYPHMPARQLATEITLAKAWIVSEVMSLLYDRNKTDFELYLNWYRETLPGWLDEAISVL